MEKHRRQKYWLKRYELMKNVLQSESHNLINQVLSVWYLFVWYAEPNKQGHLKAIFNSNFWLSIGIGNKTVQRWPEKHWYFHNKVIFDYLKFLAKLKLSFEIAIRIRNHLKINVHNVNYHLRLSNPNKLKSRFFRTG